MTKAPNVKPLSAPNKDGPFGHYVLRSREADAESGPPLKYEVREGDRRRQTKVGLRKL